MKYYICTAFAAAAASVFGGVLLAFAVLLPVVLLLLLVSKLVKHVKHVLQLREYANRTENVYIVALHPKDTTVKARAEESRKLLLQSGNKTGVIVHPIYFSYAEHCNETFAEYKQRVQAFIAADRIKRHKALAKHNDFYLKHTLKQI